MFCALPYPLKPIPSPVAAASADPSSDSTRDPKRMRTGPRVPRINSNRRDDRAESRLKSNLDLPDLSPTQAFSPPSSAALQRWPPPTCSSICGTSSTWAPIRQPLTSTSRTSMPTPPMSATPSSSAPTSPSAPTRCEHIRRQAPHS
jgi:hypothetical protein